MINNENNKSELEQLISDIKKQVKTRSINKVDEVLVMKSMLNDKNFTLGVYDKNQGYIGQRSPHQEAVGFVKNVIAGATGLDRKDSAVLADNYEFTKKDANFLLTNMRDFLSIYTGTGRKINVIQNANTEACIFTREVKPTQKKIPEKDNPGTFKNITTSSYIKLASSSKCPKYKENK